MKKKRKLKKKFIVFFAIYIIFISAYLVINTFSKFNSNVTKTGTLSIAKWDVSSQMPDSTINLIAGDNTETYTLTVTSESETASNYSIIISNLPENVQVALDNNTFLSPTSGTVTFSNVGTFDANAVNTSHNHTLKIKALLEANVQTGSNINVNVEFTQRQIS